MHVHACHTGDMRTTIEMKPEHRARILELAATRGEKGFSTVVAEALELYIKAQNARKIAIRKALALKGSISDADAAGLRARAEEIRANWR
jgi:predicted transcriptional regulator